MAEPLYRQLAGDLRQQIESGAVKWLIPLGLVERRPGQGILVTPKIDPFVTTLSSDPATGPGGGEGAVCLSEVNAEVPGS